MQNLRIQNTKVIDSVTVSVDFSHVLNPNINSNNVSIISQAINVPSARVLFVNINGNTLTITSNPLTPLIPYLVTFISSTVPFTSLNGDAVLHEDTIINTSLILGPIDPSNPMKDLFINFLKDNVYDTSNETLIGKAIHGFSDIFAEALYNIRQTKNENYLSFTVTDEKKIRGAGPFDRLDQEGAYSIVRVGTKPTNAIVTNSFSFSSFIPTSISLLATLQTEALSIDSTNNIGKFNINNLILNVSNFEVTKVTSIVFSYTNGHLPYTYDLSKYGYQLTNSLYDPTSAFSYLLLKTNQIKLNEKVLDDSSFSILNIFRVTVNYERKDLGIIIDDTTIVATRLLTSVREVLPPIRNVFNLKNAPIVVYIGTIPTTGGISFIDPNQYENINAKHPAFIYEVPYRLDYVPSKAGEYSIDYSTGTVYVYGAKINDGTGAYPPLATYNYVYTYRADVDYVYDPTTSDIVALPNGNLIASPATISFNYEKTLVPNIDYKANVHEEVLNERVNNNIISLGSIKTINSPVTNVFRILNETSGEIYKPIRWNRDLIYFDFSIPPKILQIQDERSNFDNVLNEVLFVNDTLTAGVGQQIFKILLRNNNIISASEDSIGSSINSTVKLSDSVTFVKEIYFNSFDTISANLARLTTVGNYVVDYKNSIIYVLALLTSSLSIGTITYKRSYVVPQNPHVTSVNDVYSKINTLSNKNKQYSYISFTDGLILPASFDLSDESVLNNDSTSPYIKLGSNIGVFINTTFVPGITNNIKFLRGVYELNDLKNNSAPINFADSCVFTDKVITINSIQKQEYQVVKRTGSLYYINLNTEIEYISPNITLAITVTRVSDSAALWATPGTIILGNPAQLIFAGPTFPSIGDGVIVTYSFTMNDNSRTVINYNKGDHYIDYNYLADEIVVSYEYGDNVLDFRESISLSSGTNYYVTYKVGALREALQRNFGSLVNIPILTSFDTTLERERYRDALTAALQSFIEGPTVNSMKNIVSKITHVQPDLIESSFENWSLGQTLLNKKPIKTTGKFPLLNGKYGTGVLINDPSQTISFPISSNLRLEQGSLETWVIPQWDGLDNDGTITVSITDGTTVIHSNKIFIGPSEYHPTYNSINAFVLTKNDNVKGKPNKNKNGFYLYMDKDVSGNFNRWYFEYVNNAANPGAVSFIQYVISIKTDGLFYDFKPTTSLVAHTVTTTSTQLLNITLRDTFTSFEGFTFLADKEHYIFDFAQDKNKNRFSLFKDPSGYLNFKVYDSVKNSYLVSANVSSWKAAEKHHVGISWVLNTKNKNDEMHLFIDGIEVPNIIKYGTKIQPYLHEKFRTIEIEEVVGVANKYTVGGSDLITVAGSFNVTSTINFSSFSIASGDIFIILEPSLGFNPTGYTVVAVTGNTIQLSSPMPASLSNARFTINSFTLYVNTRDNILAGPINLNTANFAVSLLHSYVTSNDMVTTSALNTVTSATVNFVTQNVQPGYLIRINNVNFAKHYTIVSVDPAGHTITLSDNMPVSLTGLTFYLYTPTEEEIPGIRALHPAYTTTYLDNISNASYQDGIIFRDKIKPNDIILIRSLGLNYKHIKQRYYLWGNNTNVIQTKLPPPFLLQSVSVKHVIFPSFIINSGNSTLIANAFTSTINPTTIAQPTAISTGKGLTVYIAGNNINYIAGAVTVQITGNTVSGVFTDTLTFTTNTNLSTTHKFLTITAMVIAGNVTSTTSNFLTIDVKETNSITYNEGTDQYPLIRYSYQTRFGTTLVGIGTDTFTDTNAFFSTQDIGNFLHITAPGGVAGYYQIINVLNNNTSIQLSAPIVTTFTGGIYEILYVSNSVNNGFQNGKFVFENAKYPKQAFSLQQGLYEFDYNTYLSVPFDPVNQTGYIGSDYMGSGQANCIIDDFVIRSIRLKDLRIGELGSSLGTITKDANSIKALVPDSTFLTMLHFDSFPFINETGYYTTANKEFVQSGIGVNNNFNGSVFLSNKPIKVNNDGILNTKTEGTIEFWVSPFYDTFNDPNYRFYFDASGIVTEDIISINNVTVKIIGKASQIISVKLKVGDQLVDYYPGGSIGSDKQTIQLNKILPNEQTEVMISYVPSGLVGDRLSIYKDPSGYINFLLRANGTDYNVRAPAVWNKGTWHRLKATYKVNGGLGKDEIRFYVDGYERGNLLTGQGLLFGQGAVFGSSYVGRNKISASIKFSDMINEFKIGTDYSGNNGAYASIDNFRISNISRAPYSPFGEALDPNYNSNLNVVFPVTEDLYTTYLLDFAFLLSKNQDFVMLKSKNGGGFDFSLNIKDSFGIVNSSATVKKVLETLIKTLKPANSKVFIKYI